MTKIYEASTFANGQTTRKDFASEQDARAFVEMAGSGRVVLFIRGSDGRDRSASLVMFSEGDWRGVNIFG